MRLALYAAGFLLLAGSAFAAPVTVIQDPSNVNRNMAVNADGSINVSGTISATNPSVGTNGAAAPTSSTQIGVSDGTNLQQLIAPIDLGDGVNGNNMVAQGGWVWNGATWDRMAGTAAGGVKITNAGVAQGSTTSGQTIQPFGCRTLNALPTDSTGQTNMPVCTTSGEQSTHDAQLLAAAQSAVPAGTNIIGKVGIDQTTPGTTNGVQLVPGTSGGLSTYDGPSGAIVTNTAVAVKASAGQLYGYSLGGTGNAAACYLQIFDLGTGSVTLGTTTPKMSIGIPTAGGANLEFPNGIVFATAITVAATTTRSGSTACTAGIDTNLYYK